MGDLCVLALAWGLIGGLAGYTYAVRTGRSRLFWMSIGMILNVAGFLLIMRRPMRRSQLS
jgi:hypothetical protein